MSPRLRIGSIFAAVAVALLIVACREITAPERSQKLGGTVKSLQNPSGLVVVYPDSMRGWAFYNDQTNAVCPTGSACRMVQGPGTPPIGTGSAELYDSLSSDGKALILADYAGTRFDQLTDLHYSTYRQTANAGNNLAVSLQFNVDYDLNDAAVGYQGRLVFEPYVGIGGNVPQNTWQTWDAKAGKWWGTKATVTRNGASVTNPCVQATPCTWAQILAAFPNAGVHSLYGAVVLKAGSGWSGFRGNVDELSIAVAGVGTTYDFEPSAPQYFPATVSVIPPDSIPGWVTADTNVVTADEVANEFAAQVLAVAFTPSADSIVRGAAFANAQLTVIGGLRTAPGLEGIYLASRPNVRSLAGLDSVAAKLRSQPGVALASEYFSGGGPDYRLPKDNPGVGSWQVSPDSAAGANWAFERIGAPLAWGCSTGDAGTDVGVLDSGFWRVTDVSVTDSILSDWQPGEQSHGTSVSSIITARGDNSIGIAGVMWRSRLRIRTGTPWFMPDLRALISLASQSRVVNLSRHGMKRGPVNGLVLPMHDETVTRTRPIMQWAAQVLSQLPNKPLIVMSAGNYSGVDAKYNLYPLLAEYLPNQTLVVAATDTTDSRTSISDGGPLSLISAPGEDVLALGGHGELNLHFGATSAATPLVTGTAGLLFSFDPALSSADVRELILRGAAVHRRGPPGAPVVNAYESLKLAAQRPGAPLCGNRVWLNNAGQVMAERDSTTMPAGESLVTTPLEDWESNYINTYHGGHRIDLAEYRQFNYSGESRKFIEVPFSRPTSDELMGGTYRSSRQHADHDGSVGIKFTVVGSGANTVVSDSVFDILNGYSVNPTKSSHTVVSQDVPDSTCIRQSPQFGADSTFTGTYTNCDSGYMRRSGTFVTLAGWESAMAPQANFAIMAPNFSMNSVAYDPSWSVCGGVDSLVRGIPRHCRILTASQQTTAYYRLLRVNLTTKAWDYLPVDPFGNTTAVGRKVSWLSISERGDEIVQEVGGISNDLFGDYTCSNAATVFTALPGALDVNGNAVAPGTSMRTESLDASRWCDGVFDPSGTLAPLRAPTPAQLDAFRRLPRIRPNLPSARQP